MASCFIPCLTVDYTGYMFEPIAMWSSVCGHQMLSVEHHGSSTTPALAYSNLSVLFWILFLALWGSCDAEVTFTEYFPPSQNSLQAVMQKSQGCVSVPANSDVLHQWAVCWLPTVTCPTWLQAVKQVLLEVWGGGFPSLLPLVMLPFIADLAKIADPWSRHWKCTLKSSLTIPLIGRIYKMLLLCLIIPLHQISV